jgi:ankyrin repeat protein
MQSATRASVKSVRHVWWCLPLMLGFVLVRPNVLLQAASDTAAVADAARADDLSEVQKLIKDHVDVNTPASDGSSALLWAAYHSDAEMVKALLAAGATADAANHYGVTPLLQASRNGNTEIIRALLDGGADPTRWYPESETPLMAAARTGKVDAVQSLISRGAFVNAQDPYQEETALMWASAEGQSDVVKTLLAAGADPNLKAHVSTIKTRSHADHPSGGFTALMFAVRNGHEDVVKALIDGGADLKLTNADGASATIIAIANDRFDLAKELLDHGADPNDGSLYFAVDMHDATTDMRAHDGSRLQPNHPNQLTSLSLVKSLLDLGADVNKPFIGGLHSTTLCCGASVNATPFYRAAIAADVEVLKLMLAHGAKLEWTPTEIKPKDGDPRLRRPDRNVGRTAVMAAMKGGMGAPFAAGPGFNRLGPPPFREPGDRDPLEALNMLLAAGADPNVKAPDGSTPLHQAVQLHQVAMIRSLAAAGAKLDVGDKNNLTPLGEAEKLKDMTDAELSLSMMMDADAYHPKRNSRAEVIAALRELMHLGPNDPVPPPAAAPADKKGSGDKVTGDKETKNSTTASVVASGQ